MKHLLPILVACIVQSTTADVSLKDSGDKLQGIMDAVKASVTTVRDGLDTIDKACAKAVENEMARTAAQNVHVSDLETVQIQKAGIKGRLQAELDKMEHVESEAHSSYESTVALRAKGKKEYNERSTENEEQAKVLESVLEKLRTANAVEKAADGSAALLLAEHMQRSIGNVSLISLSSGASPGFGNVLGIFTNMEATLKKTMKEDKLEHEKKDAEYLTLVGQYKKQLQSLHKEYTAKNAQKMEAQVISSDAAAEKRLRNTLIKGDGRVSGMYREICARDAGKAQEASEIARKVLSKLETQMARVLGAVDAAPDLKESLLQLRGGVKKPPMGDAQKEIMRMGAASKARKAAAASNGKNQVKSNPQQAANVAKAKTSSHSEPPHIPYVGAAAVSPATPVDSNGAVEAPWKPSVWPKITKTPEEMTAAAPGSLVLKKSIHEKGAKTAAMWTVLKVAEAAQDTALEKVAEALPTQTLDQDVKSLVSIQKNLQQETKDKPDDAEIDKCVDDKKELTSKIVTARKAQRGAQTQAATAKSRKTAIDDWVSLVEEQTTALKDAESNLKTDWKALGETINGGDYETTLDDGIAEMDGIESEVKTYLETDGAPPQANVLPLMLKGIKKTLTRLKEDVLEGTKGLLDLKGNILITYTALTEQLDKKKEDLGKEQKEMEKSLDEAEKDLKDHEKDEKDLMKERTEVEEKCETSLTQIKASFKYREEELGALDLALRVLQSKSDN